MNNYDASHTFYGGSSLFIQYHDVIKPVYLMAVLKLLLSNNTYGLQTDIIKDFSIFSICEWYVNRSFINPLKLLDPGRKATDEQLDILLQKILNSDKTIYTEAPFLNAEKLISVIRVQKLGIPIVVYTKEFEEGVKESIASWSNTNYVYGDFDKIVSKLPNNSSYIFSDINLAKRLFDISEFNTFASVMIASDYYYNFKDKNIYKYDFVQEMIKQQKILFKFKSISLFNFIEVIKSLGENKKEC